MGTPEYRSTEPPRPSNVDTLYREHEGDDYYDRPSIHHSTAAATFCFVGMAVIGVLGGLWQFVAWLLGGAQ
jgi:hypothetical protein